MFYLLAKFTILFLLTAMLSFVLGHWWSRRSFVDVSDSFEALTRAGQPDTSLWDRLWQRLDAIPAPQEPDLAGVYQRLEGVAGAITALPRPEPVNLASVNKRLDELANRIGQIPAPEKPPAPDYGPITERLAIIESAIQAIPAPEKPQSVDLGPVNGRLEKLATAVAGIPQPKAIEPVRLDPVMDRIGKLETAVRELPKPERPEPVRLEPVMERIGKLEAAIRELPKPERPEPVHLEPLTARIEKLDGAVRAIPAPPAAKLVNLAPVTAKLGVLEQTIAAMPRPEPVDLRPVDRRLDTIETEIRSLRTRLARPEKQAEPKEVVRRAGPRLLEGAAHGEKDDLKRIAGIGPVLEKLLNHNGVFYFWQISSWSHDDIAFIDDRLDVFKGRIERDDWVRQAATLKSEAGAAREPGSA